jgi:F420-dependent oxidoreductase-like protein
MTTANETGNGAEHNSSKSRIRLGLVADSPNFPAAWDQVVEKVRLADELGFDTVWLGESWGYELFTSMSDLVRATKHIKIGAGIANIYSRSPALIASTVATLDERSGGRIVLGLGPSGQQVVEHWHGVPFTKPLQRTREYIDIIRIILRGDKLHYHGEFFQLERGFKLRFQPSRADLPIYVAAMGPKNIHLTGEIADGVLPVYWPSTKWGDLRAQLDAGSLQAGRAAHSAAIAPYITTVVLKDDATAEERRAAYIKAASPLAYYIGKMGVYYAQMLTRNGFEEDVQAVQAGWEQGMKSAMQAVSPRLLETTTIIGTAQECAAKIEQWVAAGVDEPLITMPDGSLDETAAQFSALKDALAL